MLKNLTKCSFEQVLIIEYFRGLVDSHSQSLTAPSLHPRSSYLTPPPPHANMDSVSKALALELPPGVPNTYANRAEYGEVRLSTVYHRAAGRPSKQAKN
jgi:hypothetical protein